MITSELTAFERAVDEEMKDEKPQLRLSGKSRRGSQKTSAKSSDETQVKKGLEDDMKGKLIEKVFSNLKMENSESGSFYCYFLFLFFLHFNNAVITLHYCNCNCNYTCCRRSTAAPSESARNSSPAAAPPDED